MDASFWQTGPFWIGVSISAILALPIGVLANFCYYRLVSFLDSRKITSQAKTREKALQFDALVEDLRSGRRDRYIYILRMLIGMLGAFVMGMGSVVSVLVIVALTPIKDPTDWTELPPLQMLVSSILLTANMLFSGFFLASTTRRFRMITNALEEYDDYKAYFRARWGDH